MRGFVERPGVSFMRVGGIRSSCRSSLCPLVTFDLIGIYIAYGSLSVHTGNGTRSTALLNLRADSDDGGSYNHFQV